MTSKDEIPQLRKELTDLKASLAPTPDDPAAVGKWRDEMHALAERRAAGHNPFSRADIAAMQAAAPDDVVKNIALRDARAPTGPSSQGAIPSSQQVSNVRTGGGGNRTGWQNPIPLSPPPGIAWVDAILEVDSTKQRGERMIEEAKRKAAEKE
jgi:hypothetical protein